jgi:hypothetical protein
MFFDRLSRSWEFAKTSYRILWDHKQLLVFPLLSAAAALIVSASFLLPLWTSGTIDTWAGADGEAGRQGTDVMMWVTMFLFYFANYFVIVFFNAALIACVMQVIEGERPSLAYGLGMAGKRLGQIAAWAFVSAVVGVILRSIENSNEKAGRFISAILGTAWTALTFFAVPLIVLEGAGPVEAVKRSAQTLKDTWGEALMGNFSLGLLSFLIALPILLLAGGVAYLAHTSGSMVMLVAGIALVVVVAVLAGAAGAAADMIFKGLLYSYATGQTLPGDVDTQTFDQAFVHRP